MNFGLFGLIFELSIFQSDSESGVPAAKKVRTEEDESVEPKPEDP